MRKVINISLILVTILLAYWLYNSISEPISFHKQRDIRKNAVVEVLKKLQVAQDVHKWATGEYANNFDSLTYNIVNGEIPIIKLEADPADPSNEDKFIKTVTYKNAKDSLFSLIGTVNIDSLRYIPFGKGAIFDMQADTMTHQSTLINVLEVGTRYSTFMGPYADKRFQKYDKYYDPDKIIKFGDMNSPNTNGNW